jgi:hypothetical protein
MARKYGAQFGLGLSPDVMARLERMRAVLGEPRSRVVERALAGQGLMALEDEHPEGCHRFVQLAYRAGLTWQEYAGRYATRFANRTYPPNIDELEMLEEMENSHEGSRGWWQEHVDSAA